MKRMVCAALSLIAVLFMISGTMFAHHSEAVYDEDHLVTITGTVAKFDYVNPHQVIHLDVKNSDGTVDQWALFGGSPNMMGRIGWNAGTLKVGEKLTIAGCQLRDGRKIMIHLRITRENGEVLTASDTENKVYKRLIDLLQKGDKPAAETKQ